MIFRMSVVLNVVSLVDLYISIVLRIIYKMRIIYFKMDFTQIARNGIKMNQTEQQNAMKNHFYDFDIHILVKFIDEQLPRIQPSAIHLQIK